MTLPQTRRFSPDSYPAPALPSRPRVRFGLSITSFGFFVFLVGAKPSLFGWDRSPVVGFVQIAVILVGLAVICMGGYITLNAYWKHREKTIAADVGLRLVCTGYVIAVFAGMADVFGFGTQPLPEVPHFGPVQAMGLQVGQAIIVVGFLLLIPYRKERYGDDKNPGTQGS